jgi:sugar phosphate permease
MTAGLIGLALLPATAPTGSVAAVMVLVGLGGPTVIPPVIAVLLGAVPGHRAGTASGVLNTSRQLGGALAVAVFGALLAAPAGIEAGMRVSLLLAAAVTATAALVGVAGLRTRH